ncbi:PREDICTED: nucleolar protein 10 [Ceratosolen solmsi marchali]|uniref:Nucleolar protein 10 n=1 Tax=Ceratosolen solmsi marchali TaxID=326594 RepID=A0AAJ7E0A5_9HYME|nr:PREDICTED: nucleolar protein 10 [Ceratosolen solmsi marchali]
MQVSYPNDVKIYYLSAGKSLPEWLTERKRRNLVKKNVDIRRRIELIQDFDMPGVSTSIKLSRDGQYVFATGIYKPRMKCFDVNQLSLKFERCFDSEVVTFEILSDDYSKLVFLHCDRHVEFHAAHGKYYRLRMPRFGRDMQYHYPSCDLFLVGASNEIYRLNLERGQFLQPFISDSSAINKCTINPVHHLLLIGNNEGKVEAWDPRTKNKVGILDCGFSCIKQHHKMETIPSITSLKCDSGLTLGVGTITGQVLMYDIRSNNPFMIKDHMYNLPIKNIEFHKSMDLVYSMDSSVVKIWEKQTGKIYTSIEAQSDFNDLCIIPNTGMMFMANENTKIQSYYIPSLGPAPKWCAFLDNLTEELEELNYKTIYDDYKFVTDKELDELGLSHLKGTPLLRAYMHGFFVDVRLYKKARDITKPFEYEEYKKIKILEKIKEERPNRVQVQKLPTVNTNLALKYIDNELIENSKKKKKAMPNLLEDNRFKALFVNPDFQIDINSEEYALLNPVISQMDKTKKQGISKARHNENNIMDNHNTENLHSEDEDMADSSSEDEKPWVKEVQKQYKLVKENEKLFEIEEKRNTKNPAKQLSNKKSKFYEIKNDVDDNTYKYMKKRIKTSLGDRLQKTESNVMNVSGSRGNKEITFTMSKKKFNRKENQGKGRQEFKHLLRPARNIEKGRKVKY